MNDLPYKDLFPIIHPLKEPEQKIWAIIPQQFVADINHNYHYHLPQGYMTPAKLGKAVEELKKLRVLETCNPEIMIKKYGITNFNNKPDLDDKKQCAHFWAFNAAGFFLLNILLLNNDNDENLRSSIEICFRNAAMYKIAWNEREGRRKGGNRKSQKINSDKNWFHGIWKDFSERSKSNPAEAAHQLLDCRKVAQNAEMAHRFEYSTLVRYCRQWKKEEKEKKNHTK